MKKNKLNPIKALALFAVVFGLVFITSCGDDEDGSEPTQNIMEIVRNTEGLDSLQKYLEVYPDLVAMLESDGNFTLFAPNNTAFISLLQTEGFPANIASINPEIIKNVLAYHISATAYSSADLNAGTTVTTQSQGGETIVINDDGTLLTGSTNKEIAILNADVNATNGVVHTVGSVLIPPSVGATLTPILGTNAGTLLLGASFSDLAQAILKADTFATAQDLPTLVSILRGSNKNTVFAPTNATFQAGGISAASFSGQQWYGIIANHVVLSEVLPADLETGATFQTAFTADGVNYGRLLVFNNTDAVPAQNGVGIYLDSNGDVDLTDQSTLTNLDAEVALPDAVVNPNGRIHVIAGVLSPLPSED